MKAGTHASLREDNGSGELGGGSPRPLPIQSVWEGY